MRQVLLSCVLTSLHERIDGDAGSAIGEVGVDLPHYIRRTFGAVETGRSVMRLTVGIATVGRPEILAETLRELTGQSRRPNTVIVCGVEDEDLGGAEQAYPGVQLLVEACPGLPRQRNRLIEAASSADVIVFFDDDFLPHLDYLREVERQMSADPRIVVATGRVLADGITGSGLTPEMARTILARYRASSHSGIQPAFTGYGCNFAVRLSPVRQNNILFDTRLPLYAWQEDVDFSRRMAKYGRIVKVEAASGVHLGVKSGRSSGVRLGYSQVANPLYLSRKRLGYPFTRALTHIACNVGMNLVRFIRPEAHVDRRGRLRGNALALLDLISGRITPERMLDL